MAGWDFTADSEVQKDLAQKLNEGADNFDTKIGEMYSEIDSLSTHWVGEDYDAFKTGTEGYKTALQDLSDGIRMFSTHFDLVATGTEELASELISIILNATGSGGTGGSGSGAPGGYGTPASGTPGSGGTPTGSGATPAGSGGTTQEGNSDPVNSGGDPGDVNDPGNTGGSPGEPVDPATLRTQTNSNGSYNPYGGEVGAQVSGDERTYTYYDADGNKMQVDVWDNGVLESRKTYDTNQNINYEMIAGGGAAALMTGGMTAKVQGGTYKYNSDGSYTITQTENDGTVNVYTFDKDDHFVCTEKYYSGNVHSGGGRTFPDNSGTTGTGTGGTEDDNNPSPKTTAYTIRRGDKCGITYDGQNIEVTFWATDKSSGNNFYRYVDANGHETILKQLSSGAIEDLGISTASFTVGYADDHVSMYSGITTNAEDASDRNLPTQVTPGGDEFNIYGSVENVYYGDPKGENIGGSVETYKVTTSDELHASANAHTPVLEINTTVDVPFLSQGSDLNKGRNTMYLVWDEDSGQYYELENGEYTRGGRGFTPEDLAKCKLK